MSTFSIHLLWQHHDGQPYGKKALHNKAYFVLYAAHNVDAIREPAECSWEGAL